eukprot:TRINITY_DN19368_c0_g1_i2.p1 TRINITY_DN19368_c0_g1~~TRINITY_DN19368_c0_g1_i2.p1  ORF type:complete len:306 (-),score=31.52 TRINITY_DN19368_c0_g1_i2:171-1088(-)
MGGGISQEQLAGIINDQNNSHQEEIRRIVEELNNSHNETLQAMLDRFLIELQQERSQRQKEAERMAQEIHERNAEEKAEAQRKEREDYPCPPHLTPERVYIGVFGASGIGKSACINILRGIKKGDATFAKVGVNECTMEPTRYPYPDGHTLQQVDIVDCPGTLTDKFPLSSYVQQMGLKYFALAIIMGGQQELTSDVRTLIDECNRTGVRYIYVCSKMDIIVDNQKRDANSNFNPKEVFKEVREGLQKQGIKRPYLISRNYVEEKSRLSWENEDFQALQNTMIRMIVQYTEDEGIPFEGGDFQVL